MIPEIIKAKGEVFDYFQNCGKCRHCTIKDYDEKINPPSCPTCGNDKARIDVFRNPCNNYVVCPNGHRYDILQFCNIEDIRLHQKTIRDSKEKWPTNKIKRTVLMDTACIA